MKKLTTFYTILIGLLLIPFEQSCQKDEEVVEKPKEIYSEDLPDGYSLIQSDEQNFWLDTIATGLKKPWGMLFLPNGDILFSERSGSLHRISKENGNLNEITGLPDIAATGQGGLLDIQLHPDFESNNLIYLSHSIKSSFSYTTAVTRATLQGNTLTDNERVFTASPAFSTSHHFGCRMVFQDEYLYLTIGDRGQMKNAQDLDNHCGKTIRIYHDGSIPDDNPFVNVTDAKKDIWSYGHRNAQGMAIHPENGKIFLHEHGPKGGDEINIVEKGLNYGWPEITYGIDYDGSIISPHTHLPGMEQPITYWDPSIAPCGMTFCSGDKYPNWENNIFLGGLASRTLFRVVVSDDKYISEEKLLEGIGRVRNVALSPDGFLYVAIEDPGIIFRLAPVNK